MSKKSIKSYRHFIIYSINNKKKNKNITKTSCIIDTNSRPIDAAKKLFSLICKYKVFNKNNKKCSSIFSIKEVTSNKSKIYGPYKGTIINLLKPKKIKLKSGAILTIYKKPVIKRYSK